MNFMRPEKKPNATKLVLVYYLYEIMQNCKIFIFFLGGFLLMLMWQSISAEQWDVAL